MPHTMMTILPRAFPSWKYRMAAGTSLSGYVRSMAGVTFPDSRSSRRTDKSAAFSLAPRMPSFWLTSGESSNRPQLAVEASQPPSVGLASDDDEPSARSEGPTEVGQPAVAADVEDGVVALLAVGEVVAGVVDDVIGAEARTRSILAVLHTPVTSAPKALAIWTANVPTPPEAPMISTFSPGLHLGAVTHTLQRGDPGDGDRRRLLEGEVCRLAGEQSHLSDGILGEGAVTGAVDLVARLELGHVSADGLDRAGQTPARVERLGPAEPEAHDAHEVGQASHQVPGAPIHAGRTHPHQDLVVADSGPVDLRQSEDVFGCGAVLVLDDRLHRLGVGGPWCRLDRVIERWGLRRFVLRGHRAAPIELSWDSEPLT